MNFVTCIKSVTTKNGLEFIAGKTYNYVIQSNSIKIYVSGNEFATIKNKSTFKKYFA